MRARHKAQISEVVQELGARGRARPRTSPGFGSPAERVLPTHRRPRQICGSSVARFRSMLDCAMSVLRASSASLPKPRAVNSGSRWACASRCWASWRWPFFRPIPALEGVADKMRNGGTVADVGCGYGHSCAVIAEAFPQAEVCSSRLCRPRPIRAASTSSASSIACTTWATRSASPAMPASGWHPAGLFCWSSRSPVQPAPRTSLATRPHPWTTTPRHSSAPLLAVAGRRQGHGRPVRRVRHGRRLCGGRLQPLTRTTPWGIITSGRGPNLT